jgi:predicted regulator of Ras-like GTPase activity (Roadblock/LC7/MglB family)
MRLDTLSVLPGVRACALVGEDGLPLEMTGELGDALAAELASLRSSADRTGLRLGAGQVTRMTFTSDLVEVVAVFAGSFTVGAALLRGSDTRMAQQTLARIAVSLVTQGQGLPALAQDSV